MAHETDDELEKFKQLWRDYGKQVIAGGLLAIIAYAGWNYWQSYQLEQSITRSNAYETLIEAAEALDTNASDTDRTAIAQPYDLLTNEHADSHYAFGAAFVKARTLIAAKHYDEAYEQYQWILANSDDSAINHQAKLLHIKALIDHRAETAKQQLAIYKQAKLDSYDLQYHYLEGLLLLKLEDYEGAYQAFKLIDDDQRQGNSLRGIVRLHLDDLSAYADTDL